MDDLTQELADTKALLRELAKKYAYSTEVNLATFEDLRMRKSSSKSATERQVSICAKMLTTVLHYRGLVDWGTEFRSDFPRVRKLLTHSDRIHEERSIPGSRSDDGESALNAAFKSYIEGIVP